MHPFPGHVPGRVPLKWIILLFARGCQPAGSGHVFTSKRELYKVGFATMQTPFGHNVPVYDRERTICDPLRLSVSEIMEEAEYANKIFSATHLFLSPKHHIQKLRQRPHGVHRLLKGIRLGPHLDEAGARAQVHVIMTISDTRDSEFRGYWVRVREIYYSRSAGRKRCV